MTMPGFVCYRCGTCCSGFSAIVPKDETSNLNPAYLEELEALHDREYAYHYMVTNSVVQDYRCQWLQDNDDHTTTCTAYERRHLECRIFPGYLVDSHCPIGKDPSGA